MWLTFADTLKFNIHSVPHQQEQHERLLSSVLQWSKLTIDKTFRFAINTINLVPV